MKKKICVVTGTRAEYGLLKPLLLKIEEDNELELLLYVTGAHLSPEFGLTYREIEADGIRISRKIEMLISADTPGSIVKSMGVEMLGFADDFAKDMPDMVVVLGDRYEILSAVISAMIYRIPVAHLHGGELTEGAIDEAIRHSVTKMSYLHFASTETYRQRIIQLGEDPERVYYVGALGIENIKNLKLLSQEELEANLGFSLEGMLALVTYHPVTLEKNTAGENFEILLDVLKNLKHMKIIFTKANSDTEGRVINDKIDQFVSENKERSIAFDSLGQLRYLSALQYCNIVIGNSSSGIIEVPSFHIPTINIGDRQRGRIQAESIINCSDTHEEITNAIHTGLSKEYNDKIKCVLNPYEKEKTSENILTSIKANLEKGIDIKKVFYDFG